MIEILNAAFEAQSGPIHDGGGEILKFIGDGLLAIFPLVDIELGQATARRALGAAKQALANVAALDVRRLAGDATPLEIGVALHPGEVYFGNIGAPERLDFTAIGPAVNLVSRLEQLSKRLDRPLLLSDAFARLHGPGLVSLGVHPLRGLSEPVEAFGVD
jgi:adenylate cyclase